MYYKELAKRLNKRYLDSIQRVVLQNPADVYYDCKQAATAITDLLEYKEAIDRMGNFGKLFVRYAGDPRGPMGRSGERDIVKEALSQPVITDVDGGTWRPVYEEVLQDLIKQLDWWKEQNFLACQEKRDLEKRSEIAEKEVEWKNMVIKAAEDRAIKAETRIEKMKSFMRAQGILIIPGDYCGE